MNKFVGIEVNRYVETVYCAELLLYTVLVLFYGGRGHRGCIDWALSSDTKLSIHSLNFKIDSFLSPDDSVVEKISKIWFPNKFMISFLFRYNSSKITILDKKLKKNVNRKKFGNFLEFCMVHLEIFMLNKQSLLCA